MSQMVTVGNYKLTQFIGSGSFATAWLGEHKITGCKVAVKVICKASINSVENITRFNHEIDLLKQIDHPFIIQLFDVIEDDEAYYLVMEYVENGSLFTKINEEGHLSEDCARRYFCQLLSALNYLHNEKFIIHRDLKPENILIDKYDNIRLIDFGLSNHFSKMSPNLTISCGSPAYAAPEMIQGKSYTKSVDIWSAGIILYAMVAGQLPFDDSNIQILLQKVVYTDQTYPSIMSRSLVDLLKRLLSKNPNNRLSISQIAKHPWLARSNHASIIDSKFSSSCSNIPFISSSFSMPLLSVPKQSHAFNFQIKSNSECDKLYEIQNSSSYDNLSIDSSYESDSFSLQGNVQDISQSQNEIQPYGQYIDHSIAKQMISMGLDISSLNMHLMNNDYNDITSIYKQIKRIKISSTVNSIINSFNESSLLSKMQAPILEARQIQNSNTIRRSSYPTNRKSIRGNRIFQNRNDDLQLHFQNQKILPDKDDVPLSMLFHA